MKYLFLEPVSETTSRVGSTIHDGTLLSVEQKNKALQVEILPEYPLAPAGKVTVLMYNHTEKNFFFIYEDCIPTDEDKVLKLELKNIELEQQVTDLTLAMAAIMGGA